MLSQTAHVKPGHCLNLKNCAQIEPVCGLVWVAVGAGSLLPSFVQDLTFCFA